MHRNHPAVVWDWIADMGDKLDNLEQQKTMKKFTTQEIRGLFNRVMVEEISFSEMVEIMNERVSKAVKPNFKEGDFLHSDWDDENITIIFKKQMGDNLYYHASKSCYLGVAVDNDCYWRDGGDFRHATESEKQELLDALEKKGKRWNAEKLCVEDIPQSKFKKGDKVMLKSGCKDAFGLSYFSEMDEWIGKPITVYRCQQPVFIYDFDDCPFHFHEEWLEPYEELKKGELAIFWDNIKKCAVIKLYERPNESEEWYYQHKDQSGLSWRNAIKFESKEQYERFIKGGI